MLRIACVVCLFFWLACSKVFGETVLQSDATWKGSARFYDSWMNPEFEDVDWVFVRAPTRGRCDYYADPIFFSPPMWVYGAVERGEAYFRKEFYIHNKIHKATLRANFDDDGDVYINGTLVLGERSGKTEKVFIEKDITNYLVQGENVIAVYAIDSFGGCQWASVDVQVEYEKGVFVPIARYKQTDSLWSQQSYDHASQTPYWCGTTIGDCGCATTSLANLLHGYGISKFEDGSVITPSTLNEYMNKDALCANNGCISRGYVYGAVRWDVVHGLSVMLHGTLDSPKIQIEYIGDYQEEVVRSKLEGIEPVILKSNTASHWFTAYGSGSKIFIHDPFFDHSSLSDGYGGTASKMVLYKKVNSDFRQIQLYVRKGEDITMTDRFGNVSGIVDGVYRHEIPHTIHYEIHEPHSLRSTHDVYVVSIQLLDTQVFYVQGNGFIATSDRSAQEAYFQSTTERVMKIHYESDKKSTHDIYVPSRGCGT